jgi:RNA polymerase sigma-70 factor (ECF subfamily)
MGRVKEIIKEMKGNDYRSFDEFYSMTSKLVYYVIAGIIKNKDSVEDLMQDTYLKFIQNINNVNPNQNPNAYLAQIAKNLALNEFNKQKRVIVDDTYFTNLKDQSSENGSGIDLGIINYLEGVEKEVVTLKIIGELKFREIATILDKPMGTVQWIYNTAIKKLREKVGEENE